MAVLEAPRIGSSDEHLHTLAREYAAKLGNADRKHLRFNDIVRVAKAFYTCPEEGVRELVAACDRENSGMYVPKQPMWASLETGYAWMRSPADDDNE